jgi:hypothetical protein
MSNAKEEVVIINNTPLTPRKRGVEIASRENYALALDLWRTTCAEAGLAFIVDNCTANGARKVAARYLDTGMLTPKAVRKAMQKLAHVITHNEKAQHYTLNALGNNISRYVEAPKKAAQSPPAKRMAWRWTCGKCGADSVGFVPAGVTPPPSPCIQSKWGRCDGTAFPVCEG